MSRRPLLLAVLAAAAAGLAANPDGRSGDFRRTAAQLREKALAGSRASRWVAGLTDRAGPRLAGSAGDREAVAWGLETLEALGFANVHAEKVIVKVWQRAASKREKSYLPGRSGWR